MNAVVSSDLARLVDRLYLKVEAVGDPYAGIARNRGRCALSVWMIDPIRSGGSLSD